MGYCMRQEDAKFGIPKSKHVDALTKLKTAQASSPFGWASEKAVARATTLADAMEACSWPVEHDADGNISSIRFDGEKAGDDKRLFETLAEFVDDGGFIEMYGEDGSRWRWIFSGGNVREQAAKVSWD